MGADEVSGDVMVVGHIACVLKRYVETARGHDHHPICRPLYALGWMLACF